MSTDKTGPTVADDNMLKMLSNRDVAAYQDNGTAE
jgi:hypothetical protein